MHLKGQIVPLGGLDAILVFGLEQAFGRPGLT